MGGGLSYLSAEICNKITREYELKAKEVKSDGSLWTDSEIFDHVQKLIHKMHSNETQDEEEEEEDFIKALLCSSNDTAPLESEVFDDPSQDHPNPQDDDSRTISQTSIHVKTANMS